MSINKLRDEIYSNNVKAGWWTNLETGEMKEKNNIVEILSKIALIHSEVSEATEGVRKGLNDDHLPNRKMVEVEMADAIIRILDLCGHEGWDIEGAIIEKLEYNKKRKDHTLAARMADGGKKA